jgi:hypothetical protein
VTLTVNIINDPSYIGGVGIEIVVLTNSISSSPRYISFNLSGGSGNLPSDPTILIPAGASGGSLFVGYTGGNGSDVRAILYGS